MENAQTKNDAKELAEWSISLPSGAAFPKWSAVTSDTARTALTAIFRVFGVIKSWDGLGVREDKVRQAILDGFLRDGRAPTLDALSRTIGIARKEIAKHLDDLDARDLVVLNEADGSICGVYPVTERDTGYRVSVGGRTLNAMCAIDALGVGAMYGMDTRIDSTCRECGEEIHIEVRDQGRVIAAFSPKSAVVWSGIMETNGRAADTLCTIMTFFCSREHLEAYRTAHYPTSEGYVLSIDEGMQAGRAIFAPLFQKHGMSR